MVSMSIYLFVIIIMSICVNTLLIVGNDHRLADDESLAKMLEAIKTR